MVCSSLVCVTIEDSILCPWYWYGDSVIWEGNSQWAKGEHLYIHHCSESWILATRLASGEVRYVACYDLSIIGLFIHITWVVWPLSADTVVRLATTWVVWPLSAQTVTRLATTRSSVKALYQNAHVVNLTFSEDCMTWVWAVSVVCWEVLNLWGYILVWQVFLVMTVGWRSWQ